MSEQSDPDKQQDAAEAPAETAAAEQAQAPAGEQPVTAAPAPDTGTPAVGPKILGVAEDPKPLPVVKKKLREKPKREPLPWPELRRYVAAVRDGVDTAELKELFRLFPPKLRDEVTENVRGFQKGARRPVSQHAAKQLARATHTARRMKKNAPPSAEISDALAQAMAAELIASLEPELAAEVILPKRDLLERESRNARRRAKKEEDQKRDEQRRKRRDDARSSREQTSFGNFSGSKIKGLDSIAAQLFGDQPQAGEEPEQMPEPVATEPAAPEQAVPPAAPEQAEATEPGTATEPEATESGTASAGDETAAADDTASG